MFIAALFTIAMSWKQHKCPLTDEWINKLWYICTMEYYSAIKGNEIESSVGTWMDLETVIPSEVNQKEKSKHRILMHICGIQKNVTEKQFAKQKQRQQCRGQTYGHQGGKQGLVGECWWWDELGD